MNLRMLPISLALIGTGACGQPRGPIDRSAIAPERSTPAEAGPPTVAREAPEKADEGSGALAPKPASPELEHRIRSDYSSRTDRPVAEREPRRLPEGGWQTPDGATMSHSFVLGWNRPREQDGWPTTVFYSAAEGRYWVHEGHLSGGLSTNQICFGPFVLN